MNCPKCDARTKVHDSRPWESGEVYRMRVCPVCRYRFVTFERIADFPAQGNGQRGGKRIALKDLKKEDVGVHEC